MCFAMTRNKEMERQLEKSKMFLFSIFVVNIISRKGKYDNVVEKIGYHWCKDLEDVGRVGVQVHADQVKAG